MYRSVGAVMLVVDRVARFSIKWEPIDLSPVAHRQLSVRGALVTRHGPARRRLMKITASSEVPIPVSVTRLLGVSS
jgi:hypothetical protein